MIWTEHDRYYSPETPDGDLWWGQGDLIVAPVALLDAGLEDAPSTSHSGSVRVQRSTFWEGDESGSVTTTGEASLGLAMILSHGCSLDREWNRAVQKFRRQGHTLEDARALADEDTDLDRRLAVAPVVPFADAAPTTVIDLQANRVIGFFPVCESADRDIDGGVVELSRIATIDRSAIIARLGILSDDARATLMYALARYWAYRAPKMTYELEEAIGKRIVDVNVVDQGSLGIELVLADDSVIRLLQAPEDRDSRPERLDRR